MTSEQQTVTTVNPYKFMLLKFQPHRVYGWEREIASILQVVTAPEPVSYAIYGIRAIGKSTLLKFLKHRRGAVRRYQPYVHDDYRANRKRLIWVYINFHHLFEDIHVLYLMYEGLYEELRLSKLAARVQPDVPNRKWDKRETALRLRELLQTLEEDVHTRVVFLMDDFDIPLVSDEEDHFIREDDNLLRTISDEASLIIATDEPISKLRPNITKASPLLGILRPERIGLISEEAAQKLICEPAQEANVTFTSQEVEMLLEVGGRIPYLLAVTCETYFDMRGEMIDLETIFTNTTLRDGIKTQLIERLLLLPHVDNVLSMIWYKHEALHDMLIKMARSECCSFTGAEAEQVELYSLAYPHGKEGYRIVSSLVAEYVRRKAVGVEIQNGHLDAALAKIIDGLPPIDRGVLEYLAAREGQVCTFEELLAAVWEDGTGTKRALEAAVHRLRRTVPNGHQIKNVRGAGYKYIIANSERV